MTTATRWLTEATIFWDSQDPAHEGWASRLKYDDGHEESGEWDREINERDGDLADAVIDLVYESTGEPLNLESGDIAIDRLCGMWTRPDGGNRRCDTRPLSDKDRAYLDHLAMSDEAAIIAEPPEE